MVTERPGADVRGAVARRFIEAASQAGHRFGAVMFYSDGAYVVLPGPAQASWQGLAARHGLTLAVCPAAVERRGLGLAVQDDAGFELIGLPAWMDGALKADRVVRF